MAWAELLRVPGAWLRGTALLRGVLRILGGLLEPPCPSAACGAAAAADAFQPRFEALETRKLLSDLWL